MYVSIHSGKQFLLLTMNIFAQRLNIGFCFTFIEFRINKLHLYITQELNFLP